MRSDLVPVRASLAAPDPGSGPGGPGDEGAPARPEEQVDLRLPVCAAAAWCGCLAGAWLGTPQSWTVALASVLLAGTVVGQAQRVRSRGAGLPSAVRTTAASGLVLVVLLTFAALTGWRGAGAEEGPVTQLAATGRPVTLEGVVMSDPRAVGAAFGERTMLELAVRQALRREGADGGERRWNVRERVTLLASEWPEAAALGSRVSVVAVGLQPREARGGSPRGERTAWVVRRGPEVQEPPDVWWRGAEAVRSSLRTVVAERPADQRALVPSLVVGDDTLVDETLEEAFLTTGLTHLLAVSGTNLTLLMGVVLWLGVRCGVRGRWRLLLGAFCVVGFVLVARSEPSVVRAATMGTVALFALERNGTGRGLRCLALAVLLVLAWDPQMARSPGLALSVLATCGILLLVPTWTASLERWMPRWAAVAVAVPAAAQLACTPVVTALQGEVSLVAVLANVLAAPAVAPATVLGLAAGLVGLVSPTAGAWLALPAAWSVGWIAVVAHWGAGLTAPAVPWGSSALGVTAITALCGVGVLVAPRFLARPWPTLVVVVVTALVVWRGVPERAWAPDQWLVVACDVGQGDALALRVSASSAVVVDAGPDPVPVRRCLDRLGVREVPLLVLTHFHADHVGGVKGVFAGRRVGAVEVSSWTEPPDAVQEVRRVAAAGAAPVRVARAGTSSRVGSVVVHRLWPPASGVPEFVGGDRSNDSSVVLLAETAGVRVLLTGDLEPGAQRRVARGLAGVEVDVLKVPHHGSRHQARGFWSGLAPRVALVSAGRDNSYGHPAPGLVTEMEADGVRVLRTDESGDVAVVRQRGTEAWQGLERPRLATTARGADLHD